MDKLKNRVLNGGRESEKSLRLLIEVYENKIADIKANCDLAIEGRDVKIKELTDRLEDLQEQNSEMFNTIALQEQQIEKMKCCGNCKYEYCGGSSISIDKDGNRTFHNWNEEKEDYCDVGKMANINVGR